VLHLIKMWLECPVEETDDRSRKTRTTEARDKRRGIPQGSPHGRAFAYHAFWRAAEGTNQAVRFRPRPPFKRPLKPELGLLQALQSSKCAIGRFCSHQLGSHVI
jgi:hypothetical protein